MRYVLVTYPTPQRLEDVSFSCLPTEFNLLGAKISLVEEALKIYIYIQ